MSEYSSPVGKMLGKIAGTYDGDVPEPSNELEKGLKDIAENGSSSGGGNDVIIARFEEEDGGTVVCNKTFSELKSAYDDGKLIVGCMATGATPTFFGMKYSRGGFGPTAKAYFIGQPSQIATTSGTSGGQLKYCRVQIFNDDTIDGGIDRTFSLTEVD